MKPWTITCTFFCLLLLGTELVQTATTADLNALEGAQVAGLGGTLPVYSNANAASKMFNPDIAVIGDFIGVSGSNHVNPDPALQMHESEVVTFQAIVDPCARKDFFISYGEIVTLEKGYKAYRQVPRFFEEPLFVV